MLTDALLLVGQGALLVIAMMVVLWGIQLAIRNAAIVDFGWAFGLVLIALLYGVQGSGYAPRKWLITAMVALWGLRLAFYLLRERVLGQPEEGRYQELRRKWQTNLPLKFFFFFQFQSLLCVVLSLPFLLPVMNARPSLSPLELAAVALWLIAFAGEVAADLQLAAFKRKPANRGRVCRDGLWNYSRHPNYFFEWLIWCAFALFATASPWGWLSWACPALMLFFLFRVTGIPATEAQALRSRGDDYRRYQQTTSAFVPWIPRKESNEFLTR
jgi:steroid 5-alpha reductase family enzyme